VVERIARLLGAVAITLAGGAAAVYLLIAIAFAGYCGSDNGCGAAQSGTSGGQLVAAVLVLAGLLALTIGAAVTAIGTTDARALGRLRLVAMSVLLLPLYPFAIYGLWVASKHIALDLKLSIAVLAALIATYLGAWAALADLIARRRRTSATGP